MINNNSKLNQNSKLINHNSAETIMANLVSVRGDVQGVFYRHYTKKQADGLGISGWTKNEHDGSVTIFAQGEEAKINQFIDWAKIGSPMANVSEVIVKNVDLDQSLEGFSIK